MAKALKPERKEAACERQMTANRSVSPDRPGTRSADSLLAEALKGNVPESLARSPVFRKVPEEERAKLDRAILLPAEGTGSVEEIARRFHLTYKYGVSPAALRTYARKLDQLMRPVMASHFMAGVLSCLPIAYRRKLMAGSEVMLISRLLNALHAPQTGLGSAELAKLGSILAGIARRGNRAGRARPAKPKSAGSAEQTTLMQPARLAESVRLIYGLPLPAQTDERPHQSSE